MSVHDPVLLSSLRSNMNSVTTDPVAAYLADLLRKRDADEEEKKKQSKKPVMFTLWQTVLWALVLAPPICLLDYWVVTYIVSKIAH
jgi:hypothetical protein